MANTNIKHSCLSKKEATRDKNNTQLVCSYQSQMASNSSSCFLYLTLVTFMEPDLSMHLQNT